jgi:hypothetical protein
MNQKNQIIEALEDYEGDEFFVTDALLGFIKTLPVTPVNEGQQPAPELIYKVCDMNEGEDSHYQKSKQDAIAIFEKMKKDGCEELRLYKAEVPEKDDDEIMWELIDSFSSEDESTNEGQQQPVQGEGLPDKKAIVDSIYKAYGSDSGVLFGIKERSIVEAIVEFTINRINTNQ